MWFSWHVEAKLQPLKKKNEANADLFATYFLCSSEILVTSAKEVMFFGSIWCVSLFCL